jgi:hypothetical protein
MNPSSGMPAGASSGAQQQQQRHGGTLVDLDELAALASRST